MHVINVDKHITQPRDHAKTFATRTEEWVYFRIPPRTIVHPPKQGPGAERLMRTTPGSLAIMVTAHALLPRMKGMFEVHVGARLGQIPTEIMIDETQALAWPTVTWFSGHIPHGLPTYSSGQHFIDVSRWEVVHNRPVCASRPRRRP